METTEEVTFRKDIRKYGRMYLVDQDLKILIILGKRQEPCENRGTVWRRQPYIIIASKSRNSNIK